MRSVLKNLQNKRKRDSGEMGGGDKPGITIIAEADEPEGEESEEGVN